jgi:hypothetical protein
VRDPALWTTPGFEAGVMPADLGQAIPEGDLHEIVAWLAGLSGRAYAPTANLSPWSHEGVRLGLIVLAFNLGLLGIIGLLDRRARNAGRT